MATVSEANKIAFMDMKLRYDSLSQAIKLARTCPEVREDDIKPMIAEKTALKTKYMSESEKLVKKMPLGNNLLNLGNGWWGIRYMNDKQDAQLKTEMIYENDVPLLGRDGRVENQLTKASLDLVIPGIVNVEALEMYKQTLYKRAVDVIYEYCNVQIDQPTATADEPVEESTEYRPPAVSHHAGVRWVQRKLGIASETQATEHKRANLKDIESAVIQAYHKAEKVWTAEDGIEYWFDPDNIMFVVGNNTIITLYESDFTFAKHINRQIVLEQIEVIQGAYHHLADIEGCHAELAEQADQQLVGINDQIKVLQAEIELLQSQKTTVDAERNQSGKVLNTARIKYNTECNKLFKKFDM